MNQYISFGIIFVILFCLEVVYFKIADRFNIIDKPNERSSHSSIVLRGGGIIFMLSLWIWSAFFGFQYVWFLLAVTLIAGVSFVDDIRSLPDSVRLVAQFAAMVMMFYQLGILHWNMWWMVLVALVVCVGAADVINFMDGVNGITGGVCIGLAGTIGIIKCRDGVRGAVADLCGDAGGCGVLFLQFPAEGAGEVLCRGCGVDWRGVYSAVFDRCADSGDGGYHLADIPAGVWRGWVFDDWP